ncbi:MULTISPECIES: Maf family protein [Sphingobacterium]|jgi:septum formation protein|uniref:dTTP/UTP pyrophosphatase n=1 Tax=Sphingobacterium paramultivorum TaxID=2886510 RepID=A0A7G5E5C5_9SPHI|nr:MULTISPECIES: Maf family protein [Sphingobacterium]MBB1645878.1 septum formation protein Maf [Sphingobacterium sp. UME9]MCS4166883.1 septum formation protein [Sphingobacterium sp. BIGb0116]QMV69200.1 septum formation protein Maf [Sphingobacterium paramultivorum]WSO12990.1 Maf family protein [Sphingobacterium paramultivorum]
MLKNLKNRTIILGSQSPRRKQLLAGLGLTFEVDVRETAEYVDPNLSAAEVVRQIAICKAEAFGDKDDCLVICADTIVVSDKGEILGKPKDEQEARATLTNLSGKKHLVLTAVAISWEGKISTFVETTTVYFYELDADEIDHYVTKFSPLDKAGSYGIQEWIGLIAVKKIEGEYNNVVGLPTAKLYQELKKLM